MNFDSGNHACVRELHLLHWRVLWFSHGQVLDVSCYCFCSTKPEYICSCVVASQHAQYCEVQRVVLCSAEVKMGRIVLGCGDHFVK